jgi:dipeptidyl aminopeptidase/acylaminoacyl peptidase
MSRTRQDGGVPMVTAAMCAAGRVVAEPRLDAEGRRVAFLSTAGGRAHLAVVDAVGGPEAIVTTEPSPLPSRAYGGGAFDWAPDGRHLAYAAGDGGLWWQPSVGGPARRLPGGGPVSAPAVAPDGGRVAYVVDGRDVAVVPVDGGWPVRLTDGADFALDPVWSPDGATVAWLEWDVPAMPWDSSRLVVAPADGSAPPRVVAGGEGVQVQQPRFSPDGTSLAHLTDAGGWLNLAVLDLASGALVRLEEPHEHGGPTWGPGQRSFAWSPDGTRLAVNRNEDGFGRLLVWTPGASPVPVAKAVHGGLSWRGDHLVAVRSGGRTPTQVVVYDGDDLGTRRTLAVGPVAGFDAAALPEPEVVSWPGEDGTPIPGRLYRPVATTSEDPPPLILWVHGGPTDQWQVEFRPRIAYWLDRGWAVLLADHRGSTGHGRAFAQALAGRWGELDVADAAAGLRAAAERGWGDPRRFVAMGGSAGGFTVLNLLAHHPGLCAAGVDLYGIGDLFDLDETTHRFEAHYLQPLVGRLPEAARQYRERSPVNVADRIVDPLLILQGSDDPVVPPAQSQAMADRLRSLGRTVELHLYEGEGHGWGRAATVIDELTRTEDFLRRHVLRWREP